MNESFKGSGSCTGTSSSQVLSDYFLLLKLQACAFHTFHPLRVDTLTLFFPDNFTSTVDWIVSPQWLTYFPNSTPWFVKDENYYLAPGALLVFSRDTWHLLIVNYLYSQLDQGVAPLAGTNKETTVQGEDFAHWYESCQYMPEMKTSKEVMEGNKLTITLGLEAHTCSSAPATLFNNCMPSG